ncbi:hypothetical protein [Pseudomonas sp. NFIX28]|uniref:hypothetical protein n=1 Tax=Pseudomonas sp. NFIX28 TaxID=1566235 RepID=UPI00089D5E45|nr:hypothetical protein [Pseudomonas sp. NFIX28]SDZ67004.1 hypothetical protein SAMN03159453_05805 [Pseudomonas sp. NFIX28]
MSTPEIVFGYLGGVVILGAFVWIGVALHMAYTKLDELLDHLKNCSAIMARAPLKHGGPWGKLLLIGGISGIVTFPGFYLKRGELSAEDLNNFPAPFKRKLAVLQWSVIGLLGFAALLWVIGKIVGWHQ